MEQLQFIFSQYYIPGFSREVKLNVLNYLKMVGN